MGIADAGNVAAYANFEALDIRAGTIVDACWFEKAKKPAYQLKIDFGPGGILSSSAQITDLYTPASLVGRQVLAVVNFPPRQIANFMSQCLVLGVYNAQGQVVLLQPERPVLNGDPVG